MKGIVMKRIKERFDNDPIFAITIIAMAATATSVLLKSGAKMIEASAYAYRASKL